MSISAMQWRALWGCAVLAALAACPAEAQTRDVFYKDKTITLIVGITPGGGYDQYARLLARHLPQHIAGAPTIIVRNLPGAGSLNSVLNLARIAPADGTQIGTFNIGLLTEAVTKRDAARVKFNEFAWVGSMTRDLRVCVASKKSKIQTWDDLKSGKPAIFGAAGADSNSANGIAAIRNLFNLTNLKAITGYPGLTETNLAVERGEVDGTCASWIAIPESWIRNKEVNVLVRLSPNTAPEIPDSAKFIGDIADTIEKKALVDVLASPGELARPFIMSDKVPPERVAIIRKAFAETLADPDFLADAERVKLPINLVDGITAQAIVERLYALAPEVAEKARAVLDIGP